MAGSTGAVGTTTTFQAATSRTGGSNLSILLNLVLSCVAALQAPVIMMSQNRQAVKDRLDARNDYEVNLRAEMEIRGLHAKLDAVKEREWTEFLQMQREQLKVLRRIETRLMLAGDAAATTENPRE